LFIIEQIEKMKNGYGKVDSFELFIAELSSLDCRLYNKRSGYRLWEKSVVEKFLITEEKPFPETRRVFSGRWKKKWKRTY
jgi:hypothetical protein